MPSYNSAETIFFSIQSVINQSYKNWELIVIDDCSKDRSIEIVLSFDDPRIKLIKLPSNTGVANARNEGIKFASGKYISFLDSDDIWFSEKLAKQVEKLSSGFDVICSNYGTFKNNPSELISIRKAPSIITHQAMLRSNFIGNLTGIYNSEKLGKFYQRPLGHEDYVMWLDITKVSNQALCIDEVLAAYRISNQSLSSNKFKAMKWQFFIYRNYLGFSFIRSSWYFLQYLFFALKKRG